MLSPSGDSQNHYLNGSKLWKSVIALNLANGVAFIDQLSITVILPAITRHFHGNSTIEFAATTQLIAATGGQAILGYLSNVWSRRKMLIIAQSLSLIANLLCASSYWTSSAVSFICYRILSGVAIGSISNLVNIAQSDFSPPRRRLTLQGVQGLSVATGSTLGSVLGAFFASRGHFQWMYLAQAGCAAISLLATILFVPANKQGPSRSEWTSVLKHIDYLGISTGLICTTFGLLLLCKFSSFERSKTVSFGTLALLSLAAFILLGIKRVRCYLGLQHIRPIVPFKLFSNRTICIILVQNILLGATFYAFLFSMPVALRLIQHSPALLAVGLMVPYFFLHGAWSAGSAFLIRFLSDRGCKSYLYVFLFGFATWSLAMALLGWHSSSSHSSAAVTCALALLVGFGTGSTFQNSVNAINSQVSSDLRATAIGTRNILRYFGGSLGTATVQAIINSHINDLPSESLRQVARTAVYDLELKDLPDAEKEVLLAGYGKAVSQVFYLSAGLMGVCFLLTFLMKDDGGMVVEKGSPAQTLVAGKDISRSTSESSLEGAVKEEEGRNLWSEASSWSGTPMEEIGGVSVARSETV